MCWQIDDDIKSLKSVSVAGCLGYDVLVVTVEEAKIHLSFSCWLFRL